MITLSAFKWVPDAARGQVRDLRARWALEEAGLPYRTRLRTQGDQDKPEYRALHPFGQVPILEENGLVLFESGAIVLHIGERSEALLPKDAIYNSCDVGINTSAGEGWGLIAFEHAATGAPQIVPDNSVCSELWAGTGSLLPCADSAVEFGVERATTRAEDVCAALERLYDDRAHYDHLASVAASRAVVPWTRSRHASISVRGVPAGTRVSSTGLRRNHTHIEPYRGM